MSKMEADYNLSQYENSNKVQNPAAESHFQSPWCRLLYSWEDSKLLSMMLSSRKSSSLMLRADRLLHSESVKLDWRHKKGKKNTLIIEICCRATVHWYRITTSRRHCWAFLHISVFSLLCTFHTFQMINGDTSKIYCAVTDQSMWSIWPNGSSLVSAVSSQQEGPVRSSTFLYFGFS